MPGLRAAGRAIHGIVAVMLVLPVLAGAAHAEPEEIRITVTADGIQFDGHPFDGAAALAPGATLETRVLLSNTLEESTTVDLATEILRESENGCNEPEEEVDVSCGSGEGELGKHTRIELAGPDGSTAGPVRLDRAGDGIGTGISIGPGAGEEYLLRLDVPRTVGNVVQGDEVEFVLAATARGVASGRSEPVAAGGDGGSDLAVTGFGAAPVVALAAGLLGAGIALVARSRGGRKPHRTPPERREGL
ncbi:hypothetical protein SAMN06265360_11327 [Haloechinothrix alba]|uniref:Uncharacterized protein n=1 Tax=Haloechinothrix alba TaxID=664784 RepID=A0A238Y007_9PSEU|nr:hypothetical protein [Haloechinothrix alba]SNR64636.1 hypothetical protein SAMN06265360_11327 [Haloechinothrix alba]